MKGKTAMFITRKNIVKKYFLSKMIYRFSEILMNSPMSFATETEEAILKSVWNLQRAKKSLKKNKTVAEIIFHDFKIYYKLWSLQKHGIEIKNKD